MKKFSELNKENTKVEEATDTVDFIEKLINETLSVEEGQIKGIDILTKTLNSIMSLNDSKTKVKILEAVKAMSAHSFSFVKINEAIELEKTIIKNYALFVNEDETEGTIAVANIEIVEPIITESVDSVTESKCECGDNCKCEGDCTCKKIIEESVDDILSESSDGGCRKKCIAACKKCIVACKKCITGCNNKKCGEKCEKCCAACEKCIEACEKCIEACENKSENCDTACKKCAEACKKCAEACKGMDMKCCKDCVKCCKDCVKCCEDCVNKACVTESTEPINEEAETVKKTDEEADEEADEKTKKTDDECGVCKECDVCEECECDPCECPPEEAKDIEEQEVTENVELTPEELEDFEKIDSPNPFINRFRLKDGREFDVTPKGDIKPVNDTDENIVNFENELTPEELEDFEKIDSPNPFTNRFRLKDGREFDVSPKGDINQVMGENTPSDDPMLESFVNEVEFPRDSSKLEIDKLYKLMESINTEEVLNEDHLTSKDDKVKYILDCVGKKACKGTIMSFIDKLPNYVKDGSISETVKQLSDKEVEKLYKKCENVVNK